MPQFVHLHVHTQYSILDGAASIQSLVKRAQEFGMPAIAITDHGNMFGAKEFHDKLTKAGLKPIIGCEVYVVKDHTEKDKDEKAGDHLILLAKNKKGYHNLVRLVSYSWTQGFYYKPRIDKKLLKEFSEGLVCSSACLGGEIPQFIMRGDITSAERSVLEFREIFGDDYYLELQLHKSLSGGSDNDVYPNQVKVNKVLAELAAKNNIKLIATNDVHFTAEDDAVAHDHLICLNTGRDLDDVTRMRYTGQEYFKSPDEMAALFPEYPEALANTLEIADKVELYSIEHRPLMPDFPLPEDFIIDADKLRETFLRRFDNKVKPLEDKLASILKVDGKAEEDPSLLHARAESVRHELEALQTQLAGAEGMNDGGGGADALNALRQKIGHTVKEYGAIKSEYEEVEAARIPENIQKRRDEAGSLQKKIDALYAQRNSAAEAASLESFAATDEEFGEWLTVSKQYLYLVHITYKGAHERWGEELNEATSERLNYELRTIEWMGFPGYFLIVWDFIRAAREMGVAVGPGRGSAAGSAVAYCLRITNIDPLKYDLLFERFLNPDRISLPDVDIDFDEDGRADVLRYVTEKYGKKRVAQIVTFGTMAPKMAIRDVARVQKLPLPESDRLAKLVPDRIANDKKKGETPFDWLYKEVPELRQERESENQLVRNTLRYAEKLEGSVRQTGVHACGVIIGKDDLELYAPLATVRDKEAKDKDTYVNIVQYEGTLVESVGLIKMDFLGLKTLSIIKDAIRNIKLVKGIDIDIDAIPLDDSLTYDLFSKGETTGIFQFESPGMKKYLRALKPNRLEDLIAMNALYRPGPMEKIPNFVARKHGQEKVVYDFPEMEEYLSDTYGITVYQEQVMLLSQKLAGFTGGQADTLRKAMGKKLLPVLEKLEPQFIEGATERGHDPVVCKRIWKEWEAFASYAFNKSHSTCYAYVAYQTAYLKANYPSEFMAALLTRNLSSMDKISFFMDECKRMGIKVLGPDINESYSSFTADAKGNIRFGLAAVKGVGEAAVEDIVEERRQNGKFRDIYDFMERVNMQAVNRKNVENMALAGAFDNMTDFHRSKFFAVDQRDNGGVIFLEQLLRYGSRVQAEKNAAQQSLFGGGGHVDIQKPVLPQCDEWSKLETLAREREMIGMYLSSHPLDDYAIIIKHFCNTRLTQFANILDLRERDFLVAGMVVSVQNLYTKNGKPYGRFTLEDYSGQHEFTLFDKDYEKFRPYLYQGYFLLVKGAVKPRQWAKTNDDYEPKIIAVQQLSEAAETMINELTITIPIGEVSHELIADISGKIKGCEGKVGLKVKIVDPAEGVALNFFSKKYRVDITQDLIDFLEDRQVNYRIA